MHAVLAFIITPVGRYVAIALAIVAALAWYRFDAVQDGYNSAVAKGNAAMLEWLGKADQAGQTAQTCRGSWNRDTGKCE
ncbi:MAG: hypothetical protein ACRC6I_18175 [Paracoccaceae bacterium]